MLAKLGFDSLSADRHVRISYGKSSSETQQIDVLAVDGESILVVECKSAHKPTRSNFKTEIEAIAGRKPGMIRELRKEFPDRKIKFVLATNNYELNSDASARLEAASIAHWTEDTIDYYLDLANHLGYAAKYQLLGSLFAGQKIEALENRVAAIQCRMGGLTYYSFSIEPARLLKLSYVLHRNKAHSEVMPTYQRLIKKTRLTKVSKYVNEGGFFPNSLIINIDSSARGLRFDPSAIALDGPKPGVLYLPQTYRAAYIVDGQHRLFGYANSDRAESDLIPVIAFVDLPAERQVSMFMQINENQQAVPKSLRNTLNADLLSVSDDMRERLRSLKLQIAHELGERRVSPLYDRIIIGEEKGTYKRCLSIDGVTAGLTKANFLGSFNKTVMLDAGTMSNGLNESTRRRVSEFLQMAIDLLRQALPEQYALGKAEGGYVFINNGIQGYIHLVGDIVTFLSESKGINARAESPQALLEHCSPYLQAGIDYLSSMSLEEGSELKRAYGSAGKVTYWRALQRAVNEAVPEFEPEGMRDYLRDAEMAFNTESFELIRDIEQHFHQDVKKRLQGAYGTSWFKKGIPVKVHRSASMLAMEKNLTRDEDNEVEPWDCLHLIEYYEIVTKDHAQWQEIFAASYTRPEDLGGQGAWKSKASWMVEVNRIRNENDHTYSVKESEFQFLTSIREWLKGSR